MMENYTIKKTISEIKTELKKHYHSTEINSFINLIFEKYLNYSPAKIHTSFNNELSEDLHNIILDVIEELKLQKPIQYILKEAYFYDLIFNVTPDVLIPRQETEELVDWIIKENSDKEFKILDIGTGSGCISVTLSKNLPEAIVFASDISLKAIEIAKQNSVQNKAAVTFLEFDILNPSTYPEEKFDVVVSNPPYVTVQEKKLMHKNVLEFEPELALFVPDSNPLMFYKAIIDFGKKHLNTNGKIYFEINELFGKETSELLEENNFSDIYLKKDINGKDRMLRATLK